MAATVTAAHHSIWKHLSVSVYTAQRLKSKLKVVRLDKESNISLRHAVSTKRVSKNLQRGRSGGEDTGNGSKKNPDRLYNLNPESFPGNCFWGRQLDGVAINEALHLEFKRSTAGRQGRVVPGVERSRSKWAAQKHHQCAQSSCSNIGIE